jgi:hypothetical protein
MILSLEGNRADSVPGQRSVLLVNSYGGQVHLLLRRDDIKRYGPGQADQGVFDVIASEKILLSTPEVVELTKYLMELTGMR